jgi:hypothetical protein
MLCYRDFPFHISITTHGKKKEENQFQIIPKIPGCIVIPNALKLRESQLPMEFSFSIMPLAKLRTQAELLILTKDNSLRQFVVKIQSNKLTIPGLLYILGSLIFLWSLIYDVFPVPFKEPVSFWQQGAQFLLVTLLGSPLHSLFCGGLIFILGIGYYWYYLHPQKGSLQIHFYEK